ncbi:MAG: response regulator [Myxococcota bacterium]
MAGEPILIVDDNPANLKLVSFLLSSRGYEVHTAASAAQALALLQTLNPRVILMDIQLPGMDGLELTRLLKSKASLQNTLIVAVTAFAMKGDEAKALAAGCDAYVTKPIDTRGLPEYIAKLLSSRSAGKEA